MMMNFLSRPLRVLAVGLLLFGGGIHAEQATGASTGQNQKVTGGSEDFRLGPGDQVTVRVADVEEFADKTFKIDPDGRVDFPLIGKMSAVGLTLAELKTAMAKRLSKYVTDPQITLNLSDTQSRPVSVIGEVNSPGLHQLSGPRTLIEVISLAGGIKNDAGSKVYVTRQSRWGSLPLPGAQADPTGQFMTATLSLDDLLASKRPGDNILVMPDDIISIPKADVVYVVGDVHKSGGFALSSHETISLLQAISLAEGLGPNAASAHARILRPVPGSNEKPKEIPVDVKSIFAGKKPDVPLYANDILFIPNSAAKSGARRAAEAILQVATGVVVYGR